MNYYIADCHFGDEQVIDYCHRPFSSVLEMDETMIQNWNRTVKEYDDVYIVGDFSYRSNDPENYLKRLHGRKHLVCGNHDQIFKQEPHLAQYFVEITDYLIVKDASHRLVLFHFPLLEWDGFYYGTWHVYGHIHNHCSLTQERVRNIPKALNCGADVTGFRPLTFDELVSVNRRDCERSKRPVGAV